MTHSILITKYILKVLEESEDLKTVLPIGSIYPIDARLSSTFPFAVIQRTSITPIGNKDGNNIDTVYFSIIVVDDTYIGCVTIADKIREALDGNGWRDKEANVFLRDIELQTANESIYNDAFLQTLDFRCTFEYI